MGTVLAKEPQAPREFGTTSHNRTDQKREDYRKDYEHSAYYDQERDALPRKPTLDEPKPVNLQRVRARVDKVHIDGLVRTKDDIVKAQVTEMFKAKDFQDVIVRAHKVRGKLDALGCFGNIGVYIDTSKGSDATPEGVEVTFTVSEMKRIMGGINTMVGNNEGSIIIGARAPNIFGRGERLQMEYSYGNKSSTNVSVSAVKPFVDSWLHKVLTASVFSTTNDLPWSGYKQCDTGFLLDLALNRGGTGTLKHNLQYEGTYRNISASKQVTFRVREQSGPSLKSALRYIGCIDKRDSLIFPTTGSLIQFTTEVAGLGGNIGFIKNEFVMQSNWSPHEFATFQLGFQSGLLQGISNDMQISICDNFFLGGPLNLRGFDMRGCGPRCEGNSIGGDVYWALALHLYTPLPFRPGRNSFGDLFRLHGFINGGNLTNCSFKFDRDLTENLKIFTNNVRCTTGAGIAMKLGNVARVELNLIMPLLFVRSDVLQQFQLGIGLQYL
ncbi:sorting and assembly machinery component 50 homolog B isoform X1 [Neodiprion lecontei]|uniref:Sorting and assembly machinery component 50 homolog B isoform X1 n=1 Tax=Neodiprion lecontei TaxID=441921 RepID=A0A6J0B707_NEOLC|nr:sorting and assembly machinery component 50 homolog B isoform X1 [Neodiprion lecontei]